MQSNTRFANPLTVFFMYFLFACVFATCKKCLMVSEPFFFIGSRMLVAGVGLLFVHRLISGKPEGKKRTPWIKLCLLGLLNIYAANALESYGLQRIAAAKTCLIYSLSPFMAAMLSYWIFKERLNRRKWIGLLIGVLGITPLFIKELAPNASILELIGVSWPELCVIGAALSSVYGWILLKDIMTNYGLSPLRANGLSMLIGGALALTHSGLTEGWDPIPVSDLGSFMLWSFVTLIISNVIGYNLYGYLLRKYSPTFMSLSGLVTPFFAAIMGWIVLSESISWHFFASALVITSGLVIFQLPSRKARKARKALADVAAQEPRGLEVDA